MERGLSRFIARSSKRCHNFFNTLRKNTDYIWTEECKEALQQLKTYLTSVPLLSKLHDREILFIYLAIFEHAVSVVLLCEDERRFLSSMRVLTIVIAFLNIREHLNTRRLVFIVLSLLPDLFSSASCIEMVASASFKIFVRRAFSLFIQSAAFCSSLYFPEISLYACTTFMTFRVEASYFLSTR